MVSNAIIEVLKELKGKESALEFELDNLSLGTKDHRIYLGGKIRLTYVPLKEIKKK